MFFPAITGIMHVALASMNATFCLVPFRKKRQKKRGDILFGFPGFIFRGAWLVMSGFEFVVGIL